MILLKLFEKMFIRLFIIIIIILPIQSCSNTTIGDKLKSSFDNDSDKQEKTKNTNKKEIKSTKINKIQPDQIDKITIAKENSITDQGNTNKKSIKSIKNIIFNPQPYRIILKLSGANPSAPAETVTKALRKAGVQFEVEKIERFDEESLLKKPVFKK